MTKITTTAIRFAQISDCHLFSDRKTLHHGANVFDNLCAVLKAIKQEQQIEFIIFTGDLTQDHSHQSYQNFVDAVHQVNIEIRIYFLAGNHDDQQLLHQFLVGKPFCQDKVIKLTDWSIHLVNSKSNTPAGYVSEPELKQLLTDTDPTKSQLVMMHHHAIDVGYFIDNHGLNNKTEFWQYMAQIKNLKGIACGHVHNALAFFPEHSPLMVPLFTCPATSIQFDQDANTVANANKGAGYRVFSLLADGTFNTQAYFIHP
jgi:Icc protein